MCIYNPKKLWKNITTAGELRDSGLKKTNNPIAIKI